MVASVRERALSDQQVSSYHRDGYLVVAGLFTPAEVAELRDTFTAQAANGPVPGLSDTHWALGPDDPLARYPRMMHPHRHLDKPVGSLAMKYMLDRRVGDMLFDLLGEEAIAAQSMFYFKPPGARGQAFHQDNFYLKVEPGNCIAAWVAVDDADEANGTLVVVPGSHRMDVVCPEQSDTTRFFSKDHIPLPPGMREQRLDLAAGDCLFFNGTLIHGSYPNTSTRFRRSFISHYANKSCREIAKFYFPLYDFAGQQVHRDVATGGGPCGTVEPKGPH